MNTSIWVRSLISKQYSRDKFFKYVAESIGKEFKKDVDINIDQDMYQVTIGDCIIKIDNHHVKKLQETGLYFLDRYILDELKKQGLKFDVKKSNYIKCCYGIFNDDNEYNEIKTRFNQIFNISIQDGCLFYPCCGTDTYEPLSLFINTIKEFHFASGGEIILPELECEIQNGRKNEGRCSENDIVSLDTIPFAISLSNKENYNIIKKIEERCFTNFEFIGIDDLSIKEVWKTKFAKNKKVEVYLHKFEGLLSLMTIDNISIFYYRVHEINGDNISKAAFNWFLPGAFNLLLEKLLDKALIITDGRQPDMQEDVPWRYLWGKNRVDKFQYSGREFVYIGKCKEGPNTLNVWQVNRQKKNGQNFI